MSGLSEPSLRLVLAVSLDGRLAPPEGGAAQLGGRGDRRVLEEALAWADGCLVAGAGGAVCSGPASDTGCGIACGAACGVACGASFRHRVRLRRLSRAMGVVATGPPLPLFLLPPVRPAFTPDCGGFMRIQVTLPMAQRLSSHSVS